MRYVPALVPAGGKAIHNGRPAFGLDAGDVDFATTALAATQKPAIPTLLGPWTSTSAPSATPARIELRAPHYTDHVSVRVLATGRGTVQLRSYDTSAVAIDAYRVDLPVAVPSQTAKVTEAAWVELGPAKAPADVSADGECRALYVASGAVPTSWVMTLAIIDTGTGLDVLTIYAVQVVPLLLPAQTQLA